LEANSLSPDETVPASRKLGRDDAEALAKKAKNLVVAKGKKVTEFEVGKKTTDAAVDAMLGPTGNLRAPTLVSGDTLLVGFNEERYQAVLGA
jgi:arsenate reductase-like glutaredoxin family protein